jgi:hypothetical protein
MMQKLKEAGFQVINIPRSLMSSFDLSAPFRQGIFFATRPKQFGPAFIRMFQAFGSEKAFNALQEEIFQRPTHKLMKENKLAITDMDRFLTGREERFMSSWVEKIPIIGHVVRASNRAYVGFLNKLRADVFDDLVSKAEAMKLSPTDDPKFMKDLAGFINAATGRGSLGGVDKYAVALNSFFFSPRLFMSRVQLLNPHYYYKLHPVVRREALYSLFSSVAVLLTILGLAKMAGLEVGIDPRNADFGKIKIGNTRVDIAGGFLQYLRVVAQLMTGQIVSSTTGKTLTLGEGYKPLTRLDIIQRFMGYKQAPVMSFVTDLLRGRTMFGEEIKIPKELGRRLVPMVIQDIYEVAMDDPTLLPLSALGIIGFGVQTYGKKPRTVKIMKARPKHLRRLGMKGIQ